MKRITCLLLCLVVLAGCGNTAMSTRTEFLLDTFVTVTLYGSDDEQVLDGVMEICRRYDAMLDRHSGASEVWQLNHAGEALQVSPELYGLIDTALGYCAASGGRYDITIAPVMDLWNFKSDRSAPPDREALVEAMSLVNWQSVVLHGDNTVELLGGAQVDLGSIAKGYIADAMADYLREQKVRGAIVNLGGNVITVGHKAMGKEFEIGVQKPFEDREEIVGSLFVTDLSLVSSGVYERFFRYEGELYHHLLDANTGFPADSGLLSVTIVCPSSTDADALSTLCFFLGAQEGMALLEDREDAEGIFLTADGEILLTSGLEGRFRPV